jgi:hypothetical protein
MEYRKIVSVTGLPGLFEIISSKTDGAVVRSLDDKSTKFVSSRSHNLSHLESIEVYTENDNVNLVEIFFAIDKAGEKLPAEKDAAAVTQFFRKVYPVLDFERVYNSDMKKMIRWYGILKSHAIEIKLSEEEVTEDLITDSSPTGKKEPESVAKASPKSAKKDIEPEEGKASAKKAAEPRQDKASAKKAPEPEVEKAKAKNTQEPAPDKAKTAKKAAEPEAEKVKAKNAQEPGSDKAKTAKKSGSAAEKTASAKETPKKTAKKK